MPYFERVDSYDTYNGYDSDFHYDYNANSGGGQAFLGGTFVDKNGITHSPKKSGRIYGIFQNPLSRPQ